MSQFLYVHPKCRASYRYWDEQECKPSEPFDGLGLLYSRSTLFNLDVCHSQLAILGPRLRYLLSVCKHRVETGYHSVPF